MYYNSNFLQGDTIMTTNNCVACGKSISDDTNVGIPFPSNGLCHCCDYVRYLEDKPLFTLEEVVARQIELASGEPPF
jgi:hypothetical protein